MQRTAMKSSSKQSIHCLDGHGANESIDQM
jgi:hypothetical protein